MGLHGCHSFDPDMHPTLPNPFIPYPSQHHCCRHAYTQSEAVLAVLGMIVADFGNYVKRGTVCTIYTACFVCLISVWLCLLSILCRLSPSLWPSCTFSLLSRNRLTFLVLVLDCVRTGCVCVYCNFFLWLPLNHLSVLMASHASKSDSVSAAIHTVPSPPQPFCSSSSPVLTCSVCAGNVMCFAGSFLP